jgi:hypothetical protein
MTNFSKFDQDSLYNAIYFTLEKELGKGAMVDYLTDRVCDAVSEWVPKKGDFWLEEDSGMLWINKGWEVVTAEAPE